MLDCIFLGGWFLALIVMFCCGEGLAQTEVEERTARKPPRVDITPLIGYRTSMTFPTVQNTQALGPNLILTAQPSYGVAFGWRLNEEDLIEFRWARQTTDVHLENSFPSPHQKVVLDQFHGDFTHEYILDEWPVWARPYVIGSVGGTHLSGASGSGFTRFSFGLGGGIKVYFNRHLGWKMQAQWLPLVVNPTVGAFVCGGGCIVRLNATLVSQGELVMGPVLRF
jgi:hypothetical protein